MSSRFDLAGTQATWRRFAETLVGTSPLYEVLCRGLAEKPRVLGLLEASPETQRQPMLLLAAVHDLLLAGHAHRLATYYPTLGGTAPTEEPPLVEAFASFCAEHEAELSTRLASSATQTNEIGRVAVLRPALAALTAEGLTELAVADFGSSAGLNLLLDSCKIHYSNGVSAGPPAAPIDIACELRGPQPSAEYLTAPLGTIVHRRGLDQSPISVFDERATRWLLACVWPDQVERFRRTKRAIECAKNAPPEVVKGRLPVDAKAFLESFPRGPHLCILTTWVLAYLGAADRQALAAVVTEVARTRDITWILAESPSFLGENAENAARAHKVPMDGTMLYRRSYREGALHETPLASMHGHATWVRFFPDASLRA